jgi:Ribbon-helix-helix protein, copG family
MRTTLTIDDDVAAMLEQLRRDRETSLKDLINEALRRGLLEMNAPRRRRKPYRTPSVDLGTPRIPDVDNIAEVLAIIEGEAFK